uniref:THAP4_heme-bd domain-containing protein n=1 Tax=Panagrellus redivivus TaxID=6233 RepID=A0A7E4W442_PANRE
MVGMIVRVGMFALFLTLAVARIDKCRDKLMDCYHWVASNPERCETGDNSTGLTIEDCEKACQKCGPPVPEEYDLKKVPPNLHKVAFLVGKWRSEFGGKADFPTIPRFTYGEELDIKLAKGLAHPVLNYTAFAWDNSDLVELHSENGFISGAQNSSLVSLNTVMNNGFVTIEEGESVQNSIRFALRRIGRINFSRDLPVNFMLRDWILLNETFLESRLIMGTKTHKPMLHTHILYKKIYP